MPKLTDAEWEKVLAELYGDNDNEAPKLNALWIVIPLLAVWAVIFTIIRIWCASP